MDKSFWCGKRVCVTGHTGFKGAWLSFWLAELGAKVYGYSLSPENRRGAYYGLNLRERLRGESLNDVQDLQKVTEFFREVDPEVVFHLAAQPLVRRAYEKPIDTYSVNILGTANILEAARSLFTLKSIVVVTTDKCYKNLEWEWPYRETDALGGHDPYSASKACAELVVDSYRKSFLAKQGIGIATARAGNVIGGGDHSSDRLLPDFIRSIESHKQFLVRSPSAVRPWQHVIEPIAGYLLLAKRLFETSSNLNFEALNFGPNHDDIKTVRWIVEYICEQVAESTWVVDQSDSPHEATLLSLDNSKAKAILGWKPRFDIAKALDHTLDWWRCERENGPLDTLAADQIADYVNRI